MFFASGWSLFNSIVIVKRKFRSKLRNLKHFAVEIFITGQCFHLKKSEQFVE